MRAKFGNDEENTDNNDTDDKKWRIWDSPLEFVKNTKSKDNSDDDNAHLTETEVKYYGIFVFYLNRNLVLHIQILPQIEKICKSLYYFSSKSRRRKKNSGFNNSLIIPHFVLCTLNFVF